MNTNAMSGMEAVTKRLLLNFLDIVVYNVAESQNYFLTQLRIIATAHQQVTAISRKSTLQRTTFAIGLVYRPSNINNMFTLGFQPEYMNDSNFIDHIYYLHFYSSTECDVYMYIAYVVLTSMIIEDENLMYWHFYTHFNLRTTNDISFSGKLRFTQTYYSPYT